MTSTAGVAGEAALVPAACTTSTVGVIDAPSTTVLAMRATTSITIRSLVSATLSLALLTVPKTNETTLPATDAVVAAIVADGASELPTLTIDAETNDADASVMRGVNGELTPSGARTYARASLSEEKQTTACAAP